MYGFNLLSTENVRFISILEISLSMYKAHFYVHSDDDDDDDDDDNVSCLY